MQEANPTPTPVVSVPAEVGQPKKSNFLVILLSILLIISVAISGFFAYQTQKLVKELNLLKTEEKIVAVDTKVLEVDLTANWKTYNDSKFNYLFKFPDTWTDQTSTNDKDLGNFSLKSNEDEWITGTVFTGAPDLENDKKNGGSSHSFVLNSQKYLFVVYSECMGPGCGVSKKHLDIFGQIVDTFKFSNSDPTASWKIYTNTSSNYQIKYPSDWKVINQSAGSMGAVVADARYIEIGLGEDKSGTVGIEELQMIPPSEESNLNATKVVGNLTLRCNGKFTTDTKTWCWVKVPNLDKYLNIQVFKNTDEKMNEVLDQILSTLKFTN